MTKRLYRSSKDRVFLGVCGGIGEYFNVDPVVIRVVWVLSAFAGGAGILVYIIAAVIMPVKAEDYGIRTYDTKAAPNSQANKNEEVASNSQANQNQQAEGATTDETMTESPAQEDTAEPDSQSNTQNETDSNN